MKNEKTKCLDVLIIEENPQKREELVAAMNVLGARSTVAVSPFEVLPYADNKSRWDIIFTNLNPHGMSTKRYYDMVREINGKQPLVVVSPTAPYKLSKRLKRDKYAALITNPGFSEIYQTLLSFGKAPKMDYNN